MRIAGIIISLIFILMFTCAPLQAAQGSHPEEQPTQVDDSNPLFLIYEHGLYGFIDITGKVVIEPQYADTNGFAEGLAPVLVGDDASSRYGFIDKTGKVVMEPQYEFAHSFSEGLAQFRTGTKWGYIDKMGNIAVSPQFDFGHDFSDGLALVRLGDKQVYIDKTGNVAIDGKFDDAESFSEGLAAVVIDDGGTKRWAYIDTAGNIVINTNSDTASCFSEALAVIGTDDETGWLLYIDKFISYGGYKGQVIGNAGNPGPRKLGYIDKTGKVVIEPKFDYASPFSEGLASFREGNQVEGKYGYIDKTGSIVIPPQYDGASYFSGGLAVVRIGDEYGYIDKNGNVVIELQFYGAAAFTDGLAEVRIDRWDWGRYVYINKEGQTIWMPDITPSSEDIYMYIFSRCQNLSLNFLYQFSGTLQ